MGTIILKRILVMLLIGLLVGLPAGPPVQAQAPVAGEAPPTAPLSAQQLEELVGRIALYPDDLVAIILPASTFVFSKQSPPPFHCDHNLLREQVPSQTMTHLLPKLRC